MALRRRHVDLRWRQVQILSAHCQPDKRVARAQYGSGPHCWLSDLARALRESGVGSGAAAITGLVVGLLGTGLTSLCLVGWAAVQGTSSCERPSFVLLLTILAPLILLGAPWPTSSCTE